MVCGAAPGEPASHSRLADRPAGWLAQWPAEWPPPATRDPTSRGGAPPGSRMGAGAGLAARTRLRGGSGQARVVVAEVAAQGGAVPLAGGAPVGAAGGA